MSPPREEFEILRLGFVVWAPRVGVRRLRRHHVIAAAVQLVVGRPARRATISGHRDTPCGCHDHATPARRGVRHVGGSGPIPAAPSAPGAAAPAAGADAAAAAAGARAAARPHDAHQDVAR